MTTRNAPFAFLRDLATRWDAIAIVLVIGLVAFLGEASHGLLAPLTRLEATPLSLDPAHLPEYAARTTLRMFAALGLSLVFTLTYATWAAKSARAGKLLIPILDILQSVPILGFISDHGGVLHVAGAGPRARRRARRDLRDLHQPGLEHGVQLLPVAAHRAGRAHRGRRVLSALAVDALLAARSAVRHCRRSSGT